MAVVDAILQRLLHLHPKIIDLTLDRMWTLLEKLGNPHLNLPAVIHVAGTNGKGSTIAFMRTIMEDAGLSVSTYTSPHLVHFHERIYLGGKGHIADKDLSALLKECEKANGSDPITFFEITTAAAFLAFSRQKSDYLLLETGLGGRLDATNVISDPALCIITPVDLDHQQFLGETLADIAGEKAGILKKAVPAVIAPQPDSARDRIERIAFERSTPLSIGNQDWQVYEQHGRLIFQNDHELLDLPMPGLKGRHQVTNAGTAIAAIRQLGDERITTRHIESGLDGAGWPARLQKLAPGFLHEWAPAGCEIWLDGGHNPAAGRALAEALADLNDRSPRPLVLIAGMLNTKDPGGFFEPFAELAQVVFTIAIPNEENALSAKVLASLAAQAGLSSRAMPNLETALDGVAQYSDNARILIGGSLYLAGNVLALHNGEQSSLITGTTKK